MSTDLTRESRLILKKLDACFEAFVNPESTRPSSKVRLIAKDCGFLEAIDQLLLSPEALGELGEGGIDLGNIASKLVRIDLETVSAKNALHLRACFYPSDFLLACLRAGRAGNV